MNSVWRTADIHCVDRMIKGWTEELWTLGLKNSPSKRSCDLLVQAHVSSQDGSYIQDTQRHR